MLVRVTRTARRYAAILIGALSALCVVAPSAAVAFAPGDRAVHCLTDEQLGLTRLHHADVGHAYGAHAKAHVHADGATQHDDGTHHQGAPAKGNDPAACCGLYGLTAMAVDAQLDLPVPSRRSSLVPVSFERLAGRDPDRINRPPIILPSL